MSPMTIGSENTPFPLCMCNANIVKRVFQEMITEKSFLWGIIIFFYINNSYYLLYPRFDKCTTGYYERTTQSCLFVVWSPNGGAVSKWVGSLIRGMNAPNKRYNLF